MWRKLLSIVWIGTLALLWGVGLPSPLMAGESSLIPVEVKGITTDPRGEMAPIVLLEEKTAPRRVLPIWIGLFEAQAIAMEMESVVPPRPMTHDLIKNILAGVGATVQKVVVTELRNNTFYANIILQMAGNPKEIIIDSRPSDAIALALRVRAPIYVEQTVMETAPLQLEQPSQELRETSIIEPYGFSVQELTPVLAELFHLSSPEGLLVADVKAGSVAERDGLRRGDVLLQVGKKKITDPVSFKEEMSSLAAQKSDVLLQVHRKDGIFPLLLHAPR